MFVERSTSWRHTIYYTFPKSGRKDKVYCSRERSRAFKSYPVLFDSPQFIAGQYVGHDHARMYSKERKNLATDISCNEVSLVTNVTCLFRLPFRCSIRTVLLYVRNVSYRIVHLASMATGGKILSEEISRFPCLSAEIALGTCVDLPTFAHTCAHTRVIFQRATAAFSLRIITAEEKLSFNIIIIFI